MTPVDLELDEFIAAFEAAHARGTANGLRSFLPPAGHPRRADVLRELVRVDLEFAWDRGERRGVEYYRERLPELFADAEALHAVVAEEERLRHLAGSRLKSTRRLTTSAPPPVVTTAKPPGPGDLVAGFRLESELGRGAYGRVYLARQADLADRQVALKLSAKFPGESKVLARLQHANIVPVYSVHKHGELHVVCMPYLGPTTLADFLNACRKAGKLPASGRDLVSTLADQAARTATSEPAEETAPAPAPHPAALELFARFSYPEAVLWLGAELADGLAHAHARGVLHRDVKPANILVTDEGRPMLLDFNLAADVVGADEFVGGTLRYMAPEHLAAMLDGPERPDARSDVYALGLVLYELLAGRPPFADDAAGPWRTVAAQLRAARLQPPPRLAGVSPAVAAILAKALEPDPDHRYQSAADLRDDLRRQLAHEPLRFAPDHSPRERLSKWAKRHPRLSSSVTLGSAAAVLLVLLSVFFLLRQQRLDALEADQRLTRTTQARDQVRALLADNNGPAAQVTEALAIGAAALDDADHTRDARLREVVGELQYQLAKGHARVGAEEAAFAANDRAAELLKSRATIFQQAALAQRFGRPRLILLESDRRGTAAEDAQEAITTLSAGYQAEAGNPAFWLQLGRLHASMGNTPAARAHLAVAARLDPTSPWPHFHAGLAALEQKDFAAARDSFTAALAVRRDLPEAKLNRALAQLGLRDPQSALDDLADGDGELLPRLFFIRESIRRQLGDAAGAERDRQEGLKRTPTDAAGWNARGEARLRQREPDAAGALADFAAAVRFDPLFRQGYENQASVLSEHLQRPEEAVNALDAALVQFPDYTLARAGRGVLLARLGRVEPARADADAVLRTDAAALPRYQAGCVYALTGDPARALATLRQALRLDPAWAKHMPGDPDLKALHARPDFRELVRAANELARDQ